VESSQVQMLKLLAIWCVRVPCSTLEHLLDGDNIKRLIIAVIGHCPDSLHMQEMDRLVVS